MKNGFSSNTLRLVFGNITAQAINLLTIPIITRLFSPDSFGVLTLFMSVSAIIISISGLRFESVILLPEKNIDGYSAFTLCLVFTLGFSFIISVFSFVLTISGVQLPETYVRIQPYLIAMTVYVFLSGLFKASNFIAIRKNQFRIQAIARVNNSLINKVFSISYGLLLIDTPIGLIGGLIAGYVASCYILVKTFIAEYIQAIKNVELSKLKEVFFRYRSFAIFSGSNFFESLSREIVPLMFGMYFGPVVVGFIGLTKRIIQQPLAVFGDAISNSFFQKITEHHRKQEDYSNYSFELFKNMLAVTLIPLMVFDTVAIQLFGIIFGPDWQQAGLYFCILSVSYLSNFLYRPMSIIFDVQEKQGLRFYLNLIRFSINVITVLIGIYLFNSAVKTILLFSFCNTLLLFIKMVMLLNLSGVKLNLITMLILKNFIFGLIVGSIPLSLKYFGLCSYYYILICATLLIFCYYIGLYYSEPQIKRFLEPLIGKR